MSELLDCKLPSKRSLSFPSFPSPFLKPLRQYCAAMQASRVFKTMFNQETPPRLMRDIYLKHVTFFIVPHIFISLRELLLQEGIWDMIRVDHGTEFALMLFVQQMLKDHRGNPHCEPFLQTQSCQVFESLN